MPEPHCPKCGCTDREKWNTVTKVSHAGTYQGFRYTQVIKRRTRCAECGQRYFGTFYARPAN